MNKSKSRKRKADLAVTCMRNDLPIVGKHKYIYKPGFEIYIIKKPKKIRKMIRKEMNPSCFNIEIINQQH